MNTNPNQNPPQGIGARTSVIRVALAGFAVVGFLVFGFLFLQSMRERDWAIAISTVVGALSVIPWASYRSSARDCCLRVLWRWQLGHFCGIGAVIGYLELFHVEWFREIFNHNGFPIGMFLFAALGFRNGWIRYFAYIDQAVVAVQHPLLRLFYELFQFNILAKRGITIRCTRSRRRMPKIDIYDQLQRLGDHGR